MRLIDGDRLEEVLTQHGFSYCGESEWNQGVKEGLLLAKLDVDEAPTIEAEPTRHGKWIYKEFEPSKVGYYECSECGYVAFNEKVCHYCYNCGARMEIANENAD